jgi:hypothetical protein
MCEADIRLAHALAGCGDQSLIYSASVMMHMLVVVHVFLLLSKRVASYSSGCHRPKSL